MRKLASIVIVKDSTPLPETDFLDITTIQGKAWNVVTKRNSLKPGDKAVFFEIDSALPADDQRFDFLKKNCLKIWTKKDGTLVDETIRIKTIKLKGVLSQGLLLPIEIFPEIKNFSVDDDVTDALKVRHFDEVAENAHKIIKPWTPHYTKANRIGNFPTFIPKTDEERIQNLADYPQKLKNVEWEVSEKNDGSSMTVFFAPNTRTERPYGVCSRNFELKLDDNDSPWIKTAEKFMLKEKLEKFFDFTGREIALQGELVGPGMNGNRDNYEDLEFHIFRIWNIDEQNYMTTEQRYDFCKKFDIPHVKIIHKNMRVFDTFSDIAEVLLFAEGKTDRGNEREGLVFKEANTSTPRSFKAVSNKYLLKQK